MIASVHPLFGNVAEFALSYLLIMALPGANFLVVAQASTAATRRTALAAALGIGTGATLLALAATSGASIVAADPRIGTLGKLLLATILVGIGLRALRRACLAAPAPSPANGPHGGGYFCIGLLTAVTNPVTSAFFVSASIQAGLSTSPLRGGLLVGLVFVLATGWFGGVAIAFSSRHVRERYARWRRTVDLGVGMLLAGLGIMMSLRLLSA